MTSINTLVNKIDNLIIDLENNNNLDQNTKLYNTINKKIKILEKKIKNVEKKIILEEKEDLEIIEITSEQYVDNIRKIQELLELEDLELEQEIENRIIAEQLLQQCREYINKQKMNLVYED